jgi:peptidoglycan-associated lipoprotein
MLKFESSPKRLCVAAGLSLLAAALLAGCASGVKLDTPAPVETRKPMAVGASGSDAGAASGAPQSAVSSVDLGADNAASPLTRVIYFDFDSYVVKDDYRPVLESHAKYLTSHPQKHETLEGNTDDRGGREYNLALGQQRAEAVQKSLTLLGVPASQLEAVSFGEERPAVEGTDEAARAKNRRVEIKDR